MALSQRRRFRFNIVYPSKDKKGCIAVVKLDKEYLSVGKDERTGESFRQATHALTNALA